MRHLILAATIAGVAAPAWAGDVTVELKDLSGQPVQDAVVMLRPVAGVPPGAPIKVSWPLVMAQQNISFQPHVLIVPVGSTVAFPNKDKVRHHVYSFSAAKTFELKLYGRDETRSVVFDKPGVVSLGCNIHDSMIGFIYVVDTPYVAKSAADGTAVVHNAPAGAAQLVIWHPDLKSRSAFTRPLVVSAAAQRTAAAIDLRPAITRSPRSPAQD